MHRVERWIVYPVLALLCAAAFLGTRRVDADAPPDAVYGVLTVSQIRVVGADGAVLALLGQDEDGGVLRVASHPAKGKGGMLVDTVGGGGRIVSLNADAKEVGFLGAGPETKRGLLYLAREEGSRSVEISDNGKGGYLLHYGAEGKLVAYCGTAANTGSGLLVVGRADGTRGVEVAEGAKGGYLTAFNDDGKEAAYLGASTDKGVGLLGLFRRDGKRMAFAYADEQGGGLRLLKGDGTEVLNATAGAQGAQLVLTDAVGTVTLPLRK